MKRETTPVRITDKIVELCNQVVPESEPEYIPVEVQPWSLPNECFPNVERMVREHGGRQVNGWAIWQWANMVITTEAHAVWENAEGKVIDITPHNLEEKSLMTTVGKIVQQYRAVIKEFPSYKGDIYINIDDCGLGGGVTDRLEEVKQEEKLYRMVIIPVNAAGRVPDDVVNDRQERANDIYDNMTTYLSAVQIPVFFFRQGQNIIPVIQPLF